MTTKRCYCYEDLNYIVYEYLVRLDIRQLTIEQWEELIKDLNVLKDIEAQYYLKPDILDIIDI